MPEMEKEVRGGGRGMVASKGTKTNQQLLTLQYEWCISTAFLTLPINSTYGISIETACL